MKAYNKHSIFLQQKQSKQIKIFPLSKYHYNPQTTLPQSQKHSVVLDYVNKRLEQHTLNSTSKSIENSIKINKTTSRDKRSHPNLKLILTNNNVCASKRVDYKRQYETFNPKPTIPNKNRNIDRDRLKDYGLRPRAKSKGFGIGIEASKLQKENKRLKGVIEEYQMKLGLLEKKMNIRMKQKNTDTHDNYHYYTRNANKTLINQLTNKLSQNSINSLSITLPEECNSIEDEFNTKPVIKVKPKEDLIDTKKGYI